MTYDQYWYGDVSMVKAYREADKLRQERMNTEAWLQGMYIYDLLTRACPIPAVLVDGKKAQHRSYMTEPYQLFKGQEVEEEQDNQEENELLQAELYMRQMVWAGKNWGKGG